MLRRIGYAVVLWAVPYVTAIPLLPLMQRDPVAFKTIMIVEGALVGAVLAVRYFAGVAGGFLREGIRVAAVWILVNWALDAAALLPFAGLTVPRYFVEIGLRYLAMASIPVAIGYALTSRETAEPPV